MRRIFICFSVAFFFVCFSVFAETLDELWEQARREPDTGKAIEIYSRIIKQSPDSAEAYLGRAKLYKKAEQFEKSIEDFNRYIELEPEEFLGYYAKDRVYTQMKNYEMAVKTITNYISRYPEDPKGFFERGYIYRYFEKKLTPAIKDFSQVIKLSPEDSTAYIERGLAYISLGDYDEAINDFSKAIEFDPDNSIAYRERGRCHKEKKEYDEALDDFEKSVKFNPEYMWTYYLIASTYYYKDMLEEALEYTSQALEIEKHDVVLELRANILRDMGLHEKAIQEIKEAFKTGGKNYFTRGSIYFVMKEEKKAHEDFMEAFKVNEDADEETFNKLIISRVTGLRSFLSDIKDQIKELKRKYGPAE